MGFENQNDLVDALKTLDKLEEAGKEEKQQEFDTYKSEESSLEEKQKAQAIIDALPEELKEIAVHEATFYKNDPVMVLNNTKIETMEIIIKRLPKELQRSANRINSSLYDNVIELYKKDPQEIQNFFKSIGPIADKRIDSQQDRVNQYIEIKKIAEQFDIKVKDDTLDSMQVDQEKIDEIRKNLAS